MRIDKEEDNYLFAEYSISTLYNKMPLKDKIAYVNVYGTKATNLAYNPMFTGDTGYDKTYEETMLELVNCLYREFNVDCISESFAKTVIGNADKILETICNESVYNVFGKCSGFLLFAEFCLTYSVNESAAYFTVNTRDISSDTKYKCCLFPSICSICQLKLSLDNLKEYALLIGLILLAVKKLGEVETVCVGAGVRRVLPKKDDSVIVNKMPFKINLIDSSWLRTIVRTEGFGVRGHFRLQPYGVGWRERRLIYIKPFQKHGYVRTAKKVVYERDSRHY